MGQDLDAKTIELLIRSLASKKGDGTEALKPGACAATTPWSSHSGVGGALFCDSAPELFSLSLSRQGSQIHRGGDVTLILLSGGLYRPTVLVGEVGTQVVELQ